MISPDLSHSSIDNPRKRVAIENPDDDVQREQADFYRLSLSDDLVGARYWPLHQFQSILLIPH